jgi:hypothetical protein
MSYERPGGNTVIQSENEQQGGEMALLEYMLLALLGSAGAATPGGPVTRTFTADSVTQPSGGTECEGIGLVGQVIKGSRENVDKKGRHQVEARRRRRAHKQRKVTDSPSKVSSSPGGKGGVKPNMNQQPPPKRPRAAPSNSNKNSK